MPAAKASDSCASAGHVSADWFDAAGYCCRAAVACMLEAQHRRVKSVAAPQRCFPVAIHGVRPLLRPGTPVGWKSLMSTRSLCRCEFSSFLRDLQNDK